MTAGNACDEGATRGTMPRIHGARPVLVLIATTPTAAYYADGTHARGPPWTP